MSGKDCAKAYYEAISSYVAHKSNLRQIFIVDISDSVFPSFDSEFVKARYADNFQSMLTLPVKDVEIKLPSKVVLRAVSKPLHENSSVDAIVSLEDEYFSGSSFTAKSILALCSEELKDQFERLYGIGKFPEVRCQETKHYNHLAKYIFHAMAPIWDSKTNIKQLENDVYDAMVEVLTKAEKKSCRSLAVPLLALKSKSILLYWDYMTLNVLIISKLLYFCSKKAIRVE